MVPPVSGSQFPPGVAEQLAAQAGLAPADAAPAPAAPCFVDGAKRSQVIPLDWPVTYDGIVYSGITLRRLTVAEVRTFLASIEGRPDDAPVLFPVFRTPDDAPVPEALFAALDDDDMTRLNEAAVAFLPRRFGGVPASASIPATGAPTAP